MMGVIVDKKLTKLNSLNNTFLTTLPMCQANLYQSVGVTGIYILSSDLALCADHHIF
jgi:hypothetical protein